MAHNGSNSEYDEIDWAVLAREDYSSTALDDEELTFRIAPLHSWMDKGGSSASTASPIAWRGNCNSSPAHICRAIGWAHAGPVRRQGDRLGPAPIAPAPPGQRWVLVPALPSLRSWLPVVKFIMLHAFV